MQIGDKAKVIELWSVFHGEIVTLIGITDTKYIFADVSSVKAHQNYGMRVKLTSSRQVKWTLELINVVLGGAKL
jgi:hypothetical protein